MTNPRSGPKSALGKRLSDAGDAGFVTLPLESCFLAPTARFWSLARHMRS